MDSPDFAALPGRVQRRAWQRYQAHFEAPEADREKAARDLSKRENTDAEQRRERLEARARRRAEFEAEGVEPSESDLDAAATG